MGSHDTLTLLLDLNHCFVMAQDSAAKLSKPFSSLTSSQLSYVIFGIFGILPLMELHFSPWFRLTPGAVSAY